MKNSSARKFRTGRFPSDESCLKRAVSEPTLILDSFDPQTLAKMEIALGQACAVVSTGSQKHRSRRYIAKRIVKCASRGNRDLDSLTRSALAAAKELNARRVKDSGNALAPALDKRRTARLHAITHGIRQRRPLPASRAVERGS